MATTGQPIWFRRLRLRHLELLLALRGERSLTAAADALHMTQPAVSQQLADIEAAIGVPLFERGRGLRPTAFGHALLRYAEQALAGAQRAGDEVEALRAGASGLVHMGVMLVASTVLVPRAVSRLRAAGDRLHLVLVEDIQQGLWPRLERGELDLIVGRIDARVRASGLPFEALYEDPHVVVCGPAHPLARRRKPGWDDALGHSWVLPPAGTSLRMAVDASFNEMGLAPPTSYVDSGSTSVTLSLLPLTDSLGVMSRTAARHHQKQGLLKALPLELSVDVGPVGVTWLQAQPGPAVQRVLDALRLEGRVLQADGAH
jgi:DNA-binding transcriptional LysR family regulator